MCVGPLWFALHLSFYSLAARFCSLSLSLCFARSVAYIAASLLARSSPCRLLAPCVCCAPIETNRSQPKGQNNNNINTSNTNTNNNNSKARDFSREAGESSSSERSCKIRVREKERERARSAKSGIGSELRRNLRESWHELAFFSPASKQAFPSLSPPLQAPANARVRARSVPPVSVVV